MIVEHLPGGGALVDREALAVETGLSEVTIRLRLCAVAYHAGTGRALYDHDTATLALSRVVPWPAMQGRRRRRQPA